MSVELLEDCLRKKFSLCIKYGLVRVENNILIDMFILDHVSYRFTPKEAQEFIEIVEATPSMCETIIHACEYIEATIAAILALKMLPSPIYASIIEYYSRWIFENDFDKISSQKLDSGNFNWTGCSLRYPVNMDKGVLTKFLHQVRF